MINFLSFNAYKSYKKVRIYVELLTFSMINRNILYKCINFILSNFELKIWSLVLCVNWSVPRWRKRSSLFFNLKAIQDFFKLKLSMFCVKLVNICMRVYDVTWWNDDCMRNCMFFSWVQMEMFFKRLVLIIMSDSVFHTF